MPRVEGPDHTVVLAAISGGSPVSLLPVAAPGHSPRAVQEGFVFSADSLTLAISCLLGSSDSNRREAT